MSNPILPLNEYVPDGEPHVFGNRVYLYGSHDKANSDRFCVQDYTVYSAPVEDLTQWTCHGVTYRKEQDLRSREGKLVDFYAPDCVRGNDGRYYLYYVAMGPNVRPFGPMSVAVSDAPEGPFTYLSDIKNSNGTPLLTYLTNDPAVMNDNGRIYLYYGWGLGRDFRSRWMKPVYDMVQSKLFQRPVAEIRTTKPSILSCAVVELEEDMFTVKAGPKAVLDSKTTADKKSGLYHHAFYEAASIRKFGDLYYLVYSSGENCELAYATSKYPDRGFTYRGVIISNSDLGYKGNTKYHAAGGTIHGGIEKIGEDYYIFYHRCTNNTNYSRQACCERITIDETGFIPMVEMTTQGAGKEPLEAKRRWQAVECCNLYNDRTGRVTDKGWDHTCPAIVSENGNSFIADVDDGTVIGYKYLHFENVKEITFSYRAVGDGALWIYVEETVGLSMEPPLARVKVEVASAWTEISAEVSIHAEKAPLYFVYRGKGKMDLKEFEIR